LTQLKRFRVNPRREFVSCPLETIVAALDDIAATRYDKGY